MTERKETEMEVAFGQLRACVPERDAEGGFDEEAQIDKIKGEYEEMREAYRDWVRTGGGKEETKLLEEAVDTMTALATLLWAHTSGDRVNGERILQAIKMVNLKNKLRGYHDFGEEGEEK